MRPHRIWTQRGDRRSLPYKEWLREYPSLGQKADSEVHKRPLEKTAIKKRVSQYGPDDEPWGWHPDQFRPWLTPVLGHGCLTVPSADRAPLGHARSAVRDWGEEHNEAGRFLIGLINSRQHRDHPKGWRKTRIEVDSDDLNGASPPLEPLWKPLAALASDLSSLVIASIDGPELFDDWMSGYVRIEVSFDSDATEAALAESANAESIESGAEPDQDARLRRALRMRRNIDAAVTAAQVCMEQETRLGVDQRSRPTSAAGRLVHGVLLVLQALKKGWLDPDAEGRNSENGTVTRPFHPSVLEWVTEALWASILVGAPTYLTSDEFVVRLQLLRPLVDGHCIDARIRFPRVDSLVSGDLADDICQLFEPPSEFLYLHTAERCTLGDPGATSSPVVPRPLSEEATDDVGPGDHQERLDFYDAVASVLLAQAERNRDKPKLTDEPHSHYAPALAFVLTFDLELEAALLRRSAVFHVAIPVLYATGTGSPRQEAEARWLFATFDHRKYVLRHDVTADEVAQFLTTCGPSVQWLNGELDDKRLLGPVVIKLNGSPLHHLDGVLEHLSPVSEALPKTQPPGARPAVSSRRMAAASADVDATIHHALTIDEYTTMQSTFVEAGREPSANRWPRWLKLAFPTRYWLFFGLRLGDWSVRQRLFTLIQRIYAESQTRAIDDTLLKKTEEEKAEDGATPGSWGVAFNPDVDAERSYLLDWLMIEPVRARSEWVTSDLLDYADDVIKSRRRRFRKPRDAPDVMVDMTLRSKGDLFVGLGDHEQPMGQE